jgi:hypothetical protein
VGQGISEVLTFAVGVAISPVPIIAVILMLFSARARVNGPVFLAGWVVALAVVSGVVYVISDQGNASTSSTASDAISWGKIVFGCCSFCSPLGSGGAGRRPEPSRRCRSGWRASTCSPQERRSASACSWRA